MSNFFRCGFCGFIGTMRLAVSYSAHFLIADRRPPKMKKLFVIWAFLIPFFNAEGRYVLPAEVDKKGTLDLYSYVKWYALEQEEGSQKDLAFKYGIKWVPISNFEVYIEPPLIRYHDGRDSSCTGLGDSDIGVKALFTQGIGGYAFVRLPTGAKEMPRSDDWAPKFSNNKLGGGGKLIFSQELVRDIKVHLNIGVLANIGDLISEDNPIPANRVSMGAGISLPYGVFVEGETDINRYNDDMTIADNPKRAVVGVNYAYRPGIKLLGALEYGTWGTGDPPLHKWSYGWIEDINQWDITLGLSYSFGVKAPPKVEVAAQEELTERDKKIAEMRQELVEKETELVKLGEEYKQLEEENTKLKEEVKKRSEYGMHEVRTGECLWKIAKYVYGSGELWPLIYQVNKERIKDPSLISPNQKLKILPLPEAK